MAIYGSYYDYSNMKNIMDYFYINIDKINFDNIDDEKISQIYKKASGLSDYFNNKEGYKTYKYLDVMKRMNRAKVALGICSAAEKFLMFIYIVDPNYELFVEYGVANKTTDIKKFMVNKYGIYDPKLIKVEKFFVEHFLSQNKKDELNEKIEKRIYC